MIKYDIPIRELIEDFLNGIDLSPLTKALYKKTLDYFIYWVIKNDRPVKNITTADLINYRDHLRNRGLSPATIDNYIASIKSFYSWLVKYDFCNINPAQPIKKEKKVTGLYMRQCLNINQVKSLIKSTGNKTILEKRNRAIIKLMVYTGLRCIEIRRLNYGDIKHLPDRTFIQIWRKGSREAGDSLPLPQTVEKSINDYLDSRIDLITEKTPVFISHSPRNKGNRLQTQYISKMIKAHLRKIGLTSRQYSAHSLRHTAASLAHLAGAKLYEIQFMLAHSKLSQTEQYLRSIGKSIGNEESAIYKIEKLIKKALENKSEL